MSFINTALGDISKSDPAEILARSLSNECPFDVPTITFSSEEFRNCSKMKGKIPHFYKADMVAHMEGRFKDFFDRHGTIPAERAAEITAQYAEMAPTNIFPVIVSNLIIPQYVQSGCVVYPFKGITGPFAHETQDQHQDADSGMVFTFNKSVDGTAYGESNLQLAEGEMATAPASAEEWQFFLLWHEYAHTTGAAEPQADKIAAIITRQAFGRSDIVTALADQRMAMAVLKHHDNVEVSYYGLPLVQNLDAVAQMSDDEVNAHDIDSLRSIRFETHEYKPHKVRQLGEGLTAAFADDFKDIREKRQPITMSTLVAFAEKARELGKANPDPDAQFIADRFVTAIDRLSSGQPAYNMA